MIDYSKTILVQFNVQPGAPFGLGTQDDLALRYEIQEVLAWELGLSGTCDGGQSGSGTMEIVLYVDDVETASRKVMKALEDHSWLSMATIAAWSDEKQAYDMLYPPDGAFDLWGQS